MITITRPKSEAIEILKTLKYDNEVALLEHLKDAMFCKISFGVIRDTPRKYDKVGTSKNLKEILVTVCELMQVSPESLQKPNRVQRISDTKKIYCYIAWKYTLASLKQIAGQIGNIDHTTVIHNRDRANNLMAKDFRGDLAMVEEFIANQYPKLRNIDKS